MTDQRIENAGVCFSYRHLASVRKSRHEYGERQIVRQVVVRGKSHARGGHVYDVGAAWGRWVHSLLVERPDSALGIVVFYTTVRPIRFTLKIHGAVSIFVGSWRARP